MKKTTETAIWITYGLLAFIDFHRFSSLLYWIFHHADLLGDSPITPPTPTETLDVMIGLWYFVLLGIMLAATFFIALRHKRNAPLLAVACVDHAVYLVYAFWYLGTDFYHWGDAEDLARLGLLTLRTVFLAYLLFRFFLRPQAQANRHPIPPTTVAILYIAVAICDFATPTYAKLLFSIPHSILWHLVIPLTLIGFTFLIKRNKPRPFCLVAVADLLIKLAGSLAVALSFPLHSEVKFLLPICLILQTSALIYTARCLFRTVSEKKG